MTQIFFNVYFLAVWPGIRPMPSAVKARSPNYWTPRGFPQMNLMTKEKQTLRHRKHTYGHQRGKGVVLVLAAQSCPTLCDRMGCSLPGASVHGILQSIILVWVAIPFSRGSSWPRNLTWVSHIAGRFCTIWATREAQRGGEGWMRSLGLVDINCCI